jgi:hypothetical protein
MATLAEVQTLLVGELGPFLEVTGLDQTTGTPNASLMPAIGLAISAAGGTIQNPPTVTDTDVATVSGFYRFVTLAKYYLLDTIWGNWPYVDQRDGDTEKKLSQLAERLQKKQDAIEKALKDPDAIAALKVPGPPRVGAIKVGSTGHLNPFNPFLS